MPKQHVRDDWLLPILRDLIPANQFTFFSHETKENYWQSAVQAGLVTDEQILAEVAQRTHVRLTDPAVSSDSHAHTFLPEDVARRYTVVPLQISDSTITIATGNPYDLDGEQALAFLTGRRVEMTLASPIWIAQRLDALYRQDTRTERLTEKLMDDVRATYGSMAVSQTSIDGMILAEGSTASDRPIVQLVDHIVSEGIAKRASDIHLEAEEGGVAVRYRIDGVLQHTMTLPKGVGLPLVSRIKIMAHMDIADRLRPQGGRIRVMIQNVHVDLRVSTLPASHGEKVVIRILDSRGTVRSLDSLNLPVHVSNRLRKLLDMREGLILITGPTGSGKTTTLYAALQQLLQRGLNIITVEDPVEYRVPGIVQVQVNEKAGLTFAAALRSILRQDPDVVLIGEIRDRETAAIAIQAALTGHLVFATLHTMDACSSITRLHDLGVEPAKVSAALKGVIAQRLLRRLCAECTQITPTPVPSQLWNLIPNGAALYGPMGCPACGQTGYLGRIAVTELVPITSDLERLIANSAPAATLITSARQSGAQSLWESGISYVLDGITSAEEVARVLDSEEHSAPFTESEEIDAITDAPDDLDIADQERHPVLYPDHSMTKLAINVVDVYIIDPTQIPWRVLILQRSEHTVRPRSWETVHGKMDPGETPEQAAVREVSEETGLTIQHLYNITVHSFYIHATDTVHMAIVFCAFVDSGTTVSLSEEHQQHTWLPFPGAGDHFTWPRARQALQEIEKLLNPETIGTVEDVLRVF